MERTTHYRFESTLYKVKNYRDTNEVPVGDFINYGSQKEKWSRKGIETYITEDKYLEHFADITKGVEMKHVLLVVEEIGDKLGMKMYVTSRKRKVGSKFFYVRKNLFYNTYNLRTKNLYTGFISKSKKKTIQKKCRVNNFFDIFTPYPLINDMIIETQVSTGEPQISAGTIYKNILKSLSELIYSKTGINTFDTNLTVENIFYKLFLLDNGIKIPNTFYMFKNDRISKKILKKDKNLVTSVMNLRGLYGSNVRKYLNQYDTINIEYMTIVFDLLGIDFFNMVDVENFINPHVMYINSINLKTLNGVLNNRDKHKILIGIKCDIDFNTILEHFVFREKLKKYNHKYTIKYFDKNSFTIEHYEISELLESYQNGTIKRTYGLGVEDEIQDSIFSLTGVEFFPKVLKTTEDYNTESMVQSNCVRTYTEKPNNIIVSLRVGSVTGTERATIEYQFRRNEILRVQSRAKFNNDVPETWNSVLEILDYRMSSLYNKGKLTLPTLVKEYKLGNPSIHHAVFERGDEIAGQIRIAPTWDIPLKDDDNLNNFFDDMLFQ